MKNLKYFCVTLIMTLAFSGVAVGGPPPGQIDIPPGPRTTTPRCRTEIPPGQIDIPPCPRGVIIVETEMDPLTQLAVTLMNSLLTIF